MSYPIDEPGRDSAQTPVQNGWRRSREVPRSLCIVSRDPLRCSELVLSLQASLRPHEDLQVILDRRRKQTSTEAHSGEGERLVERRRHHHIDLALKRNGFVIVPATPIAPVATGALDEPATEREQFARIVSFTRRRRARRLWVVGAPLALVLALFMLLPPVDSLLHQILPEAPPPSKLVNSLPAVVQVPLITGIPTEIARDRRAEPPRITDREPSSAQRPADAARAPRTGANGAQRVAPARERRLYAPAVWMPEVTERFVAHARAAERLTTRTVSRTKVWLTGNVRSSRSMSIEAPMAPAQGP
jgi:hypothetical protein